MRWHAPYAWLPEGLARDVTIEAADGRFTSIVPGAATATAGHGAVRLRGLVLPGFANAHSHAFHRALRGRTQGQRGSFWTWRERMYTVAGRLDPDAYLALARAAYAEMALAGMTAVGEFHYLHHGPGGQPYADPNAMGAALVEAAGQAGVRLTLLDTCYLAGGLGPDGHLPLDTVQRRFSDGDADRWATRVAEIPAADHLVVGAAAHSVRAVPRHAFATLVDAARDHPLHVHVSEQPAENTACLEHYGETPVALLEAQGVLGPSATAVHATHLTGEDIAALARTGSAVCLCPTTERDLADGIGPARLLADAGVALCFGSDEHAVVDLLEEARAMEMDERLASGTRGHFVVGELVEALTAHGQVQIGWPDAGRLAIGARADLVAVRLDTVRTAGSDPAQALLAATSADVDTVVVDGRTIVSDGRHVLGDIATLLSAAIDPLWEPR